MKKLRLQLDQLAVESFSTSAAAEPRGTVDAHGTQFGPTCGPENTCGPLTCGAVYCEKDTVDPLACGGGSGGCSQQCTPPSGVLSCVGCTTYDYTVDPNADTCGFCMSRESEAPERCRCV